MKRVSYLSQTDQVKGETVKVELHNYQTPIWVFPKIGVFPQIIPFNKVFHYFHHPFWPLFLETPICVSKGQIKQRFFEKTTSPMPPSAPPLEQWWLWWDRNKPSLWPKSSQVQIHSCFLVLKARRGLELRLVCWDIGMLVERNVPLLNI